MARSTQIIDQWGNPVSTKQLQQEFAAPTLGGVHSVWAGTIVSGLTPPALAEVLRAAGNGYPDQFFVLAEEMEERDLHYGAVLGTRKRAITGIDPMIVAASDNPQDQRIADAVRTNILEHPTFVDNYTTDALDGLGKGFSVIETIWERGQDWKPKEFEWRDQRHFVIDRRDGRTVRFKTMASMDGVDLPPYQFSIHRPKLKSGLPIRAGLARLAAWAFLFKSYTLKDWMAFLEVYGMPFRVGKFGRGASLDDRRILLQAVRDISSDAAAIIPKEMEIEFIEAGGGSGNAVFSSKAEYLDRQISKGVLGQTMTTDDGSSLSQATIHENVRHDIARADARQIMVTTNRDLIRPYVELNFGPQKKYPTYVIKITENEDIKALVDAVERLVPLGLKVAMPKVRERIGLEEPEEGEELLTVAATRAPVIETGKKPGQKPEEEKDAPPGKATARLRTACPDCGGFHATAADERAELDVLVDDALADWEGGLEPLLKPLRNLVENASSYSELEAGLDDLIAKMDAGPMADRLAKLMMKARGLGDIGDGRV